MKISNERYERLVWLIFFETLTILTFFMFYEKYGLHPAWGLFFWEIIFLFQLPFFSFILNDFLGTRPTLFDKIVRGIIYLFIVAIIIGFFVLILLLDWKTGLASIALIIIISLIQKREKIVNFFCGKPSYKQKKK